jgi:hypothetical protein
MRIFTFTMTNFQTPRDNNMRANLDSPAETDDFQTPLWLRLLSTPTSAPSRTCSPSDLTPPITALRNISLSTPKQQPKLAAPMDDFEDPPKYDSTTNPDDAPDLHSKLSDETPRYSRTNAYNSLTRTISSSKMLHQVLGIQPPEPYQRPPEMPSTLEQKFVASLTEYGIDRERHDLNLQRDGGVTKDREAGAALGKVVLEDIREEKESPDKATHVGAGLTIIPPVWHSGREAIAGYGNASVSEGTPNMADSVNDDFGRQTQNSKYISYFMCDCWLTSSLRLQIQRYACRQRSEKLNTAQSDLVKATTSSHPYQGWKSCSQRHAPAR